MKESMLSCGDAISARLFRLITTPAFAAFEAVDNEARTCGDADKVY
jgi:hypothetical protein